MTAQVTSDQAREHHEQRLTRAINNTPMGARTIELIPGAIVAPVLKFDPPHGGQMGRFDGGVYYSDGSTCRRGLHIKNSYVNTPSPSQTVDTEITLSGKAIFGGMLKNEHFGHFLGESLCRLWAAEQLDQSFDTIVFYPRLIGGGLPGYARDLFRLLAPSREIVILERPTKVDLLAVPDQMADAEVGFVYGHQFVRQQMKRLSSLPARTSKKLYISRSKLNTEGSILGEHEIERRLQDEGYVIVHPQELSIENQIRLYLGAEKIVFSEGSAIHLFALVAQPHQRVFIIRRRRLSIVFDWQLQTFGADLAFSPALASALWIPKVDEGHPLRGRAEVDFRDLSDVLRQGGFISKSWDNPDRDEIEASIRQVEGILRSPLERHPLM